MTVTSEDLERVRELLVAVGFDPGSVDLALAAENFRLLEHTGKCAVEASS